MPRAIPDRWIPYKACGNVIEGTRIICFKVPLKPNVQNDPEIKEKWGIQELLQRIPNLGLVIDITNTNRYYNPRDIQAAGVEHIKLLTPGREIPPESTINEFADAVDEFLKKDKDRLVGVHCTHGLNRTGYMVCRYMRDHLHIPPKEAIERFETARGYKIERKIYIDDILGKSDSHASQRDAVPVENWRTETNRTPSNNWKRSRRRSSEGIDYSFDY